MTIKPTPIARQLLQLADGLGPIAIRPAALSQPTRRNVPLEPRWRQETDAERERMASARPHTSLIDLDWDLVTGAAITAPAGRDRIASFFHLVPAPPVPRRAVDTLPGLGPALMPTPTRFITDAESVGLTSFEDRHRAAPTANSSANPREIRWKGLLLVAATAVAAFGVSFGALFGVSRGIELTRQQSTLPGPDASPGQEGSPVQSALLVAPPPSVEPAAEPTMSAPEAPRTTPNSESGGYLARGAVAAAAPTEMPRAARVQGERHATLSDNPY